MFLRDCFHSLAGKMFAKAPCITLLKVNRVNVLLFAYKMLLEII